MAKELAGICTFKRFNQSGNESRTATNCRSFCCFGCSACWRRCDAARALWLLRRCAVDPVAGEGKQNECRTFRSCWILLAIPPLYASVLILLAPKRLIHFRVLSGIKPLSETVDKNTLRTLSLSLLMCFVSLFNLLWYLKLQTSFRGTITTVGMETLGWYRYEAELQTERASCALIPTEHSEQPNMKGTYWPISTFRRIWAIGLYNDPQNI